MSLWSMFWVFDLSTTHITDDKRKKTELTHEELVCRQIWASLILFSRELELEHWEMGQLDWATRLSKYMCIWSQMALLGRSGKLSKGKSVPPREKRMKPRHREEWRCWPAKCKSWEQCCIRSHNFQSSGTSLL